MRLRRTTYLTKVIKGYTSSELSQKGVSTFFINVEEKRKSEKKSQKHLLYSQYHIFVYYFNGVEGEDYALNSDNI